ncbi:MAG: 50S ribosomal protein L3 [bacterium]|nr:50S ribosomal protein L3 [bacterium]
MSKFILGTKVNMSQVFSDDGQALPVTVISAGPIVVTDTKTVERDGYNAVQVGFGAKKEKRASKSEKGHFKEIPVPQFVKENRLSEPAKEKRGDIIKADVFAVGDVVTVSAISKGKGFQGVVKRHGFAGGRRTHGQKHSEREPGSIGGGLRTRVPKGMRMAGRMGGDRVTVKNLKIVQVDAENNLILIKGAVPGRRGTLVEIRS